MSADMVQVRNALERIEQTQRELVRLAERLLDVQQRQLRAEETQALLVYADTNPMYTSYVGYTDTAFKQADAIAKAVQRRDGTGR